MIRNTLSGNDRSCSIHPFLRMKSFTLFLSLFFFLFFLRISAQEGIERVPDSGIYLQGDVTIFSADESFNQQMAWDRSITVEGASVRSEYEGQPMIFTAQQGIEISSEKVSGQLASKPKKAQSREDLKKIKKAVADFESSKKNILLQDWRKNPSSESFIAGHHVNHEYIAPSQVNGLYALVQQISSVNAVLSLLHSQKYLHYNSKSLGFCFSKAFSVRPPPVLV